MSDFEDLDGVFAALRSDATADELAAEERVVNLMAEHHRTTQRTTMFTSRRARVATFIAAGVIGFGGVVAAGPGGFDLSSSEVETLDFETGTSEPEEIPPGPDSEDTTTTSEPEETTTTTGPEEPADVEVVYGELEDPNPDTAFNEAYCLDGNHGKTVSAVAKGEPPFEEVDPRDAAHSDCGKSFDGEEDVEDDSETDGADPEEATLESDRGQAQKSERPDNPGQSGNRGNSNGNGNGRPND